MLSSLHNLILSAVWTFSLHSSRYDADERMRYLKLTISAISPKKTAVTLGSVDERIEQNTRNLDGKSSHSGTVTPTSGSRTIPPVISDSSDYSTPPNSNLSCVDEGKDISTMAQPRRRRRVVLPKDNSAFIRLRPSNFQGSGTENDKKEYGRVVVLHTKVATKD